MNYLKCIIYFLKIVNRNLNNYLFVSQLPLFCILGNSAEVISVFPFLAYFKVLLFNSAGEMIDDFIFS